MLVYILIAIAILAISFWLSLRSLSKERLLPGSEIFTTVEIQDPFVSHQFLAELGSALVKKHSAATVSILVMVRGGLTSLYLRFPQSETAVVLAHASVRAAKSFVQLVSVRQAQDVVALVPKDPLARFSFADDMRELAATVYPQDWLAVMMHLRAIAGEKARLGGFESSVLLAVGGEGGESKLKTVRDILARLTVGNKLTMHEGSRDDLIRMWEDARVPLVNKGGFVLRAADVSGLTRWGSPEKGEHVKLWGEIVLPNR